MHKLADSHIHLFDGGFNGSGVDELAEYEELIGKYSIEAALVVGYEGADWARGNNEYIAHLASNRSWLYPVAFLFPVNLSVKYLENLSNQNFVGISLYIFSEDDVASIERVPSEVWQWLARRGWLISVNSKGQMWRLWEPILNQNLELSLLISHMGLPEISGAYPSPDEVNKELAHQYMLHKFPNVYLKLSGFYALEPTAPIFPYPKTYLYTKNLIEKCDSSRLIWGSDFTPALTTVSFAETFAHLEQWIVDDYLRRRLMYDNLRGLLNK